MPTAHHECARRSGYRRSAALVNDTTEQKGKLTAGFGASADEIGPEFTFGIYMEKLLERADPDHQDLLGRQESAHGFPSAQRRAIRVE